jgi:hypothetical protein
MKLQEDENIELDCLQNQPGISFQSFQFPHKIFLKNPKGEGRVIIVHPQANFKTLVNKNAIKHKIGAIFPESLDPPRDFSKKHQAPPPLDFQPMCIYVLLFKHLVLHISLRELVYESFRINMN